MSWHVWCGRVACQRVPSHSLPMLHVRLFSRACSWRRGRPGNVLFAFNLDVPAGELVLVTGAPASGRSTLLHLLHLDIIAGGGSVQFLTTAGTWLTYQTTSTDRYDMQQCMGYVSPQSCIEAVFYATVQVCWVSWGQWKPLCCATSAPACIPAWHAGLQVLSSTDVPPASAAPKQENMVCGCSVACLPSVVDCQEAAAVTGLDADVAQMPDGYQTLASCSSAGQRAARRDTARPEPHVLLAGRGTVTHARPARTGCRWARQAAWTWRSWPACVWALHACCC